MSFGLKARDKDEIRQIVSEPGSETDRKRNMIIEVSRVRMLRTAGCKQWYSQSLAISSRGYLELLFSLVPPCHR